MLHYLLQTVVFQLIFLLVYDVFLKKETFFNWNRAYLLITAFFSLILPFLKINSFKTVIKEQFVFRLPDVIIGEPEVANTNLESLATLETASAFNFKWEYVLYVGCIIAMLLFFVKLFRLFVLIKTNPKKRIKSYTLVELLQSKAAFSFFNYIFLGDKINAVEKQTILNHELQHVKEKHSLDLLFFEALRILFWYNPLIYMYQNRISQLHEFIADAKAVKYGNKSSYYQNLLAQVFNTEKVSFINPFFKKSLIKKRIIMLSKSKSKQVHLVKYLLLIPMVVGMLFYTSAEAQIKKDTTEVLDLSEEELYMKMQKNYESLHDEFFKKHINNVSSIRDNYLSTLKEYLSTKLVFEKLHLKMLEKYKSENNIEEINKINKRLIELKDEKYADYLERMKSQKSIDNWENSGYSGVLKKHVSDLDYITTEEQKLIDSKIVQIKGNDFYHTLIISDGLRHKKLVFKTKENEPGITSNRVENEEVSFAVIDEVPQYPGCQDLSKEENKKCFSANVNKFVAQNFNTNLGKELKLIGLQKINAFFIINKNGEIVDIKVRAPHPELEKETKRVIKLLPKVTPGKQDGKVVSVAFFLPIQFKIQE